MGNATEHPARLRGGRVSYLYHTDQTLKSHFDEDLYHHHQGRLLLFLLLLLLILLLVLLFLLRLLLFLLLGLYRSRSKFGW